MNGLGTKDSGPCQSCGLSVDPELNDIPLGGAPDPCLGILEGCFQACCGHGRVSAAYVCIADLPPGTSCDGAEYTTLRGADAIAWFQANLAKDSRK